MATSTIEIGMAISITQLFGRCKLHNRDLVLAETSGAYPKQPPYCPECKREQDEMISNMFGKKDIN